MTATKLADLQKEGQKHINDARAIAEKAGDASSWDDQTKADYDAAMAKGRETLEKIKVAKSDLAVMGEAKALADEIGVPDANSEKDVRQRAKSLGLQIVESPQFKSLMDGFGGRVPSGTRVQSAPIPIKSLITGASSTSGGAFVVNERTDIVEMLGRKQLTIRDLVSVRRTGSDAVEYVRETSHTNNAAVVAEATSSGAPTAEADTDTGAVTFTNAVGGGYKPEGAWAYEVVTANVKTIAEWVPITKRALADVAQLEGLINDELAKDVKDAEEAQILVGDGSGENFTGINGTSGVQTQAWATDFFTTTRKALTKARTVGRVNPTAWVLNPADAEALDLLKDGENRYYFGGPYGVGPRTLWGVPVVESENQTSGTGLLGDFSKAVIWDREQTSVTMSDSHADFFIRNMIAVLAEERLAFGVTRPTAFVSVDLTA
ncbi:phage major capsid protein [Mycobacterium sp. G7A2]|uniref:phage major capsid protein n=1 Tax=Mycobacterium sp. G7A2 TaxID=3317307 RepID=UPI0035A8B0B5